MFFELGDFCLKAACQLRSMKTFLKTFDVTRIITSPISEECSCYLNQLPTRRLEVRKVILVLIECNRFTAKTSNYQDLRLLRFPIFCSFCN